MKSAGILCRKDNKILLIQKKYSLAFAHFIVGYYQSSKHGKQLLKRITKAEKESLMVNDLTDLCARYFGCKTNPKKYNELIEYLGKPLNEYLKNIKIEREEVEWEIPKGKQEDGENDFDCAKREFIEETGIILDEYKITSDVTLYNTHYYLIDIDQNVKSFNWDTKEVKKIEWFDYIPDISDRTYEIISNLIPED